MNRSGGGRRPWVACTFAAAMVSTWSLGAGAFEIKTTSAGAPVHWATGQVMFTVDTSVGDQVKQGGQAVSDATAAWSGVDGAPVLQTSGGGGGGAVAVDGQNTVLVAPRKFAPIGEALAVTVLSFDVSSGAIVDADIVVSRDYDFAVLAADAKPARSARPHSNESSSRSSGGDDEVFDLPHVLAHEVGHSLGLGDSPSDATALMYGYSMPGDPSPRQPQPDDTAGMTQLYPASASSPGAAGCGQSNVAGPRPRSTDAGASMALLGVCGAWLASRRRARILVPIGAALCAALGDPTPARSASLTTVAGADAVAHVVHAESRIGENGLYETTLDLTPTACHRASCPATLRAHAWGGTVGSITQQVGENPVAGVGDDVDIALTGATVASGAAEAVVLGRRELLKP